MSNVTTIYAKPKPIEIDLPLENEELDLIIDQIRRAPKNHDIEFIFTMRSENSQLTVNARVQQ